MKRIFSFLFTVFIFFKSFCQLDTEHWFAPMFSRSSYGSSSDKQVLHLSTNEVVPFNVEIYNNNTLIRTVSIRKGDPQKITIDRKYIISHRYSDLFQPTTMGLYVKGPKKFYANLRFSVPSHAEIITSKGLAGIGKKFYVAVTPITGNGDHLNFMTGIIATEDNTKVKVSGYKPNVKFANHSTTPQSIEFTLNRGQSYIIEGPLASYIHVFDENRKGFIGAKIEADKPINVTNGNFNGQYASTSGGSDIIMDQSVPVERLGKEFAVVKGNGRVGQKLEGALIIATENNTEVYINNYPAPVATLNEGEHFIIPDTDYDLKYQGGNRHYNLYVRTTKNVYLYQLLAGLNSSVALGFNYIPPLNCFLPKNIGEIGHIDEMTGESMPTKLNFVTIKGAQVNVEGYPLTAEHGPFPLKGNNDWVTYSIPNVKGHINITSDKSITAGISAGSGVIGYGGFFAGFSTVPIIRKTGDCDTGITLEIDNIYGSYQWYLNGKPITGANSHTYHPTQSGNYSVVVRNDSCSQSTAEFTVEECPNVSVINKNICNDYTFPVAFTKHPAKIVNANSITIVKAPKRGTANIDKTKKHISYSTQTNNPGTDSFVYKFCEEGSANTCETVTVNLNINGITLNNDILNVCSINGQTTYDLTKANVGAINGVQLSYYPTRNDAKSKTNKINIPERYTPTGNANKVYVLGEHHGCSSIAEITLNKTEISLHNATLNACPVNGSATFDLTQANIGSRTGLNISYHTSRVDAENNNRPINNPNRYSSTGGKVFVKASNGNCSTIVEIDLVLNAKPQINVNAYNAAHCDTDFDSFVEIDFAQITPIIVANHQNYTVKYYLNRTDAEAGNNKNLANTWRYNANTTVFVRAESNQGCSTIEEIHFSIKDKLNLLKNEHLVKLCSNANTNVNLNNYVQYFTNQGGVNAKFFNSLVDAQNNTNPINPQVNITQTSSFFIRLEDNNACPNVATIHFELSHPIQSTTLNDVSICKGIKATLDAGAGYNAYKWSNGATTQTITVGAGTYWVELTSPNGCVHRQNVNVSELDTPKAANTTLRVCKYGNQATFDLTTANIGNTNGQVKYFHSLADAQNNQNEIADPRNFTISNETSVFALIKTPNSCEAIAEIQLMFSPIPTIDVSRYSAAHCDDNFDGRIEINFSQVTPIIAGNVAKVEYFLSQTDAENGNNPLPNQWFYTQNTEVFVKATNAHGCYKIEKISFTLKDRFSLFNNKHTLSICDTDFDGSIDINLEDNISLFANNAVIKNFYTSLVDAQKSQNAIPSQRRVNNGDTFYIRLGDGVACDNIATLTFEINTPKASQILTDKQVCPTGTTILDAGTGFTSYKWSTGETTQTITVGAGTYWVELTTEHGCKHKQFVNVTEHQLNLVNHTTIKSCPANGVGIFDLTSANIGNVRNYTIKYYPNLNDVNTGNNEITTPRTYTSPRGKVFAKVVSAEGCSQIAEINLDFYDLPTLDVSRYSAAHCDDNFDGRIEIDFSKITPIIAGNVAKVEYFRSQADAENGNNPLPEQWSYTQNTEVFVKATNAHGCYKIEKISFTIKDRLTLLNTEYTAQFCSNANTNVNLNNYVQHFTNQQGVNAKFFNSLAEAQSSRNPITNPQINLTQNRSFFVRLESANSCTNIAQLNFILNHPIQSTTLKDASVCKGETAVLDAGDGYTAYRWNNGKTTQTITAGAGTYWVELTSPNGCIHRQNVIVNELETPTLHNANLNVCPINGTATFDLTTANVGATQGQITKYYNSLADLQAKRNEIPNPQNYTTSVSKTIYVSVSSASGCSANTEIQLTVNDKPQINVNAYNAAHCDTDFDGFVEIDFAQITPIIVANHQNYTIKYYLNRTDAEAGNNNHLTNPWRYNANTSIFVRAESPQGCSTIEEIHFTIKGRLNLLKNEHTAQFCSNENTNINLNDYVQHFSNQRGVVARFFNSLAEAQSGRNPITNPQINLTQNRNLFVRLESADSCPNIAQLNFILNHPIQSTTLKDASVCKGETAVLNAGDRYTAYRWSNGATTQTITAGVGNYWVELTSPNGCIHRQNVNVIELDTPKIISVDVKNNTVTINVEGNKNNYLYSLDGGAFQDSNVFAGVSNGAHTIAVKSKYNQCPAVEHPIAVMSLINFITPNGDGLNDTIDYSALLTKKEAKFNIYDRYNALIFEGNPSNRYIWDGKAKGRVLPTASYWYTLEYKEPENGALVKYSSWILLRNRE